LMKHEWSNKKFKRHGGEAGGPFLEEGVSLVIARKEDEGEKKVFVAGGKISASLLGEVVQDRFNSQRSGGRRQGDADQRA